MRTLTSRPLDANEFQTVQDQLEQQKAKLRELLGEAQQPAVTDDSMAVLTWPGDSTSAMVVSKKAGRVWVRTVGAVHAPNRLSLCPGLGGDPYSELVVHSRFEFSDGLLLELKLP
jgi:hypothetical protein